MALKDNYRVVLFVGGVGGARLAFGMAQLLPPERLTIIVNVGDDLWHLGLRVCPDSDTVMYTLAGVVDPVNGWGQAGETTQMLDSLRRFDPNNTNTWFKLGDKDLATHLTRTQLLKLGVRQTEITAALCRGLGVNHPLLPITDSDVPTLVETEEYGELAFQEYFVRHRWQPIVRKLTYESADDAQITPEVAAALERADAIVFAPSNPWLSVAPMLAIGDLRQRILRQNVPRVAMTPIIGGAAVKGPAAKLMGELGYPVTAQAVADYYGDMLTGFVDDVKNDSFDTALSVLRTDTLMSDDAARIRVAREVLTWLEGGG